MSHAATRLARALLAYLILMVAVITLAPFRFETGPVQGFTTVFGGRDFILNVVLFFPLGFVHRLGRARDEEVGVGRAFLVGLALSAVIEGAQLFAPDRFPSFADLLANALGAALGAKACALALVRLPGATAVRALALELPLVGLTYLMVPLLWLASLAERVPPELLLLPVAAVAWIYASVHLSTAPAAHGSDEGPLRRLLLGTLLWVLVALLPAALEHTWLLITAPLLAVAVTMARFRAPEDFVLDRAADGSVSRRIEAPTLRVALIPFAAFLVAAALWPPTALRSEWAGTLALLPPGQLPTVTTIFDALAHLAGFTVLGYAVAEYGGRRFERAAAVLPRTAAIGAGFALALEAARGYSAGRAASGLLLLLASVAAVLGATIYILQLRNIQLLLRRAPGLASAPSITHNP